MTTQEIKELSRYLRSIDSRSKGRTLERAADAIDQLSSELEAVKAEREALYQLAISYPCLESENKALALALHKGGTDCELCQHNGECKCNEDIDCDKCNEPCWCRTCTAENHNFAWNGKAVE